MTNRAQSVDWKGGKIEKKIVGGRKEEAELTDEDFQMSFRENEIAEKDFRKL